MSKQPWLVDMSNNGGQSNKTWHWFCSEGSKDHQVENDTGSPYSNDTENYNWVISACFANSFSFSAHCLFIAIALLILIWQRWCVTQRTPAHHTIWHGHTTRWVVLIILLILTTASIGEGILTDMTLRKVLNTQPLLYLPPCLLFVAIVLSLVYYHCSEMWQKPYMILLLMIYWCICLVCESFTLTNLYQHGVCIAAVRLWITVIMMTMFLVLTSLEINLMVTEVKRNIRNSGSFLDYDNSDDQHDMKYTEDSVNFLFKMTFWWLNWLLILGYKRPIEMEDLGTLPDSHKSFNLYTVLKKEFQKEQVRWAEHKGNLSLWKMLYRICKHDIIYAGFTRLGCDIAAFIGPLALNGIVTYVITYDNEKQVEPHYITMKEFFTNGFVLVGVIYISSSLQCIMIQRHIYQCNVIGVHIRTAIQTMVYDKSLNLSTYTLSGGSMTMGEITNHMSTDAMNLLFFCQRMHYIWSIPLKVTIVVSLLYYQVSVSAFFALAGLVVAIILQLLIGRLQTNTQANIMNLADDRLKKSNELLLGMKLLKLYGWEQLFCKAIEAVRKVEMVSVRKYNGFYGMNVFVALSIPTAIHFAVFISYPYITGYPLEPNITFAALSLINLLIEPMYFVPLVTSLVVNALISVRRLQTYFIAPEIKNSGGNWIDDLHEIREKPNDPCDNDDNTGVYNTETTPLLRQTTWKHSDYDSANSESKRYAGITETSEAMHSYALKVTDGTFTWNNRNSTAVLHDINLEIPHGKVTMIVGTVGSGKSSLLSALLGEMTTLDGNVSFGINRVNGSCIPPIAYAAQKAWLVNASLRDNILFGQPYEKERYQEVIEACALIPDMAILPGGDMTEIGEKGINLSGGQKQRVSVARAMYSNKDILLLDDPFSALDVNVGSHLFREGIMGRLRKLNRTVVLVTHQLQYLREVDQVIVMQKGRIMFQGTFEDINQQNPELFQEWQQQMLRETDFELSSSMTEAESDPALEERVLTRRKRSLTSERFSDDDSQKEKGLLVEDEELERGSVAYGVYIYYARHMGFFWAFAFFFLRMVLESFNISRDFWLSDWSEAGLQNRSVADINKEYLSVYMSLGFSCIVMTFLTASAGVISTWFAATGLHLNMLRNITKTPIRFFDTTPVGRILNRLSSDTQIIDMKLLVTLTGLNHFLWTLVFAFIVNSIIAPIFVIEILPVIVVYAIIANFFVRSSRELQRLDSVTKSPVFSHFSETLGGLSTIRAYREQTRFFLKLLDHIDTNNTTFLYLKATFGWLGLQLSMCGAVVVLMVGITTLLQATNGIIEASEVGLAISYVLMVSLTMYDFVQAATETEMQMNPVERVQYYAMVPTEDYEGSEPPSDWPSRGVIEIDCISVCYAEHLPPVLHDVTLSVKAGEKIGICGRTGSGKSSLALSFFRLVQIFKGKILIDGENIAELPLTTLRQNLSVIPQDPVLFTGSIRSNLDPEGSKSDQELWNSLEIAQLKHIVHQFDSKLDTLVSEGGENFSVGQRQLFCLARAFLRNSRILIMDEATASIDYKTEKVLQDVISSAFQNKTVLTIAHRVSTILRSDTIWVLNEGKIIECDSPENLLARPDSMFYAMVQSNK